jgi:hypothetical protein
MDFVAVAVTIFGLVSLLAGAILVFKSTTTKDTIRQQKDLIDTLLTSKEEQKGQIKDLQEKHVESTKAIAGMQGQIDALKTVPLQEIARDMKLITETQHAILALLGRSDLDTRPSEKTL